MRANKIIRSVALLGLTTALAFPAAGPAAAAPITMNTDFNGDGYNDLAVGMPNYPAAEATSRNVGLISVLYGGPNGFVGRTLLRPEPGCTLPPDIACTGWGVGLTAADMDGNGTTDLVSTGYGDRQIHSWTGSDVTRTLAPSTHQYVEALTVGRADAGDPRLDVVGVYREGYGQRLGGWYNGGSFETSRLSPTRSLRSSSMAIGDIHGDGMLEAMWVGTDLTNTTSTGPYLWYSGNLRDPSPDPMVMGSPQACEAPGTTKLACPKSDSKVALGDVSGDGYRDLVMATPSTGTINVWYGDKYGGGMTAVGFTARGLNWLTTLGTTGGSLVSKVNLAIGDVNGDGAAEIAIGMPAASVSGMDRAGAVALIPGSHTGPIVSGTQIITQDGIAPPDTVPTTDPIGEQSVSRDALGTSVSIIDLTGDGKGDLTTGAPGKNGGRGMLVVLPGTATGVPSTARVTHALDVAVSADNARFGDVLLR